MRVPFFGKDDRAHWVKVLELMYEEQMIVESQDFESLADLIGAINNPDILTKELDLSSDEISNAVEDLENLGYIKNSPGPLSITQEGFQMAHQIKTERQRRKTNHILVLLTGVLTVLTTALVI
jgi:hypothetical protein